ncbi:Hypothetical_protein [Hexamita inflata]|uniref:Hypothetical_protein n=1 Tax=Hexamita inflata TaxID=28002 RepID=A0AA86PTU4_9EUKA|nr:Hypothetical protein HINF_LOCUS28447 [Hexamita inflata]
MHSFKNIIQKQWDNVQYRLNNGIDALTNLSEKFLMQDKKFRTYSLIAFVPVIYFIYRVLKWTIKAVLPTKVYCGRQANFDFKKYQLFQNYFLYQFQLYINSMFSSVSFLFYYFFQPFGHRVNQMIDDIQRDLLQRPLYFFIQQVICLHSSGEMFDFSGFQQ